MENQEILNKRIAFTNQSDFNGATGIVVMKMTTIETEKLEFKLIPVFASALQWDGKSYAKHLVINGGDSIPTLLNGKFYSTEFWSKDSEISNCLVVREYATAYWNNGWGFNFLVNKMTIDFNSLDFNQEEIEVDAYGFKGSINNFIEFVKSGNTQPAIESDIIPLDDETPFTEKVMVKTSIDSKKTNLEFSAKKAEKESKEVNEQTLKVIAHIKKGGKKQNLAQICGPLYISVNDVNTKHLLEAGCKTDEFGSKWFI